MLVFLNHANGYIQTVGGIANKIYSLFFALVGQMVVVAFLFYSGYGIREQYRKKGIAYLKSFVPKRIGLTYIHFVVALSLFAITALVLRNTYTTKQWILSWLAWENIGNSNWFIFDILALYFVAYAALRISRNNKKKSLLLIWGLSILLWVVLLLFKGGERWWYDTILTFPLGFTYSIYKENIERFLQKKKYWQICFISCTVVFSILYCFRNAVCISLSALFFALLIVLLSMKFVVGNKVLNWMGTMVFEIYILQRIPMIVLQHFGVITAVPFLLVSALATILLAIVFHRLFIALDEKVKLRITI